MVIVQKNKYMTQTTDVAAPEQSPKPRKRGFKEAGALMAASLAFMASIGESQTASAASKKTGASEAGRYAVSNSQKSQESLPPGKSLKRVEKLPGYEIRVSPERRKLLEDATVKIVRRWKGMDAPWQLWCTGGLVTLPSKTEGYSDGEGQVLAMTAGHCFDDETGLSNKKGGPPPPFGGAMNFINVSNYEYGLVDPQIPFKSGESYVPFATVSGLSVSGEGDDWALMIPGSPPSEKSAPTTGRSFDELPAIPFGEGVYSPTPGQEVALYGWPTSSNRPIVGTGRFLGRRYFASWTGKMSKFDVVGINSKQPGQDTCHFGASGSLAIGENYISGPLGIRLNKTYDPAFIVENIERIPKNAPKYAKTLADYQYWERDWWKKAEKQLGVDAGKFDTLCFFSAPDQPTVDRLYEGFDHFPPTK